MVLLERILQEEYTFVNIYYMLLLYRFIRSRTYLREWCVKRKNGFVLFWFFKSDEKSIKILICIYVLFFKISAHIIKFF